MSKKNNLGGKSLLPIIFLAGMIICACSSDSDTEISQELAWEIVEKEVLNFQLEGVNVYVANNPVSPRTIMSDGGSVVIGDDLSPDFTSWFFFIDDMPFGNWGHPCRYVYVNVVGGKYVVNQRRWWPFNIEELTPLIEIEPEPFDSSKYPPYE